MASSMLFYSCESGSSSSQIGAAEEAQRQKELYLKQQQVWVDSVYQSLSVEQRIGQLFMVATYSGGEKYNEPLISKLITENHIGGLIFMQGTAENQARLTNQYQEKSKIPLLIGMDAEWGLGMRLTGVETLPRQMMLGASRSEDLVYEMGALIAAQCKLLGVHIDFAPDVDINNNPKNPVINFRSFGSDIEWVSKLGMAYMKGLQDNQVLASAKHFPGHGDVDVDSHLDLPVINKSKEELMSMELVPFKKLADSGVTFVMIAHLSVPQLETEENIPTTLSYNVITKLLKEDLGFKGLVITDALNMDGVTKYFKPGEVDLKAFEAGNDILLFTQDVPLAAKKILEKMELGEITEERLAYSVKKILAAKYDAGLSEQPILTDTLNLTQRINEHIPAFWEKAAKETLTKIADEHQLLGRLNPERKVAYLAIGDHTDLFFNELKNINPNIQKIKNLKDAPSYDLVIAGVHGVSLYPGKSGTYGLSKASIQLMQQAANMEQVMLVHFGNAYAAQYAKNASGLLIAYEENKATFKAVAEVLAGEWSPKGVLPIVFSDF